MKCQVEIPGLGQCEVEGEHKLDGLGREIHVKGACSWNGGSLIELHEPTTWPTRKDFEDHMLNTPEPDPFPEWHR